MELVSVSLLVPLALTYCYLISSKLPIGIPRLISLLPIIYFFITLPPHLPTVTIIALSTLFLTWLANFKLILFAFGRGPISSSSSLPVFMVCATLPIQAKVSKNKDSEKIVQIMDNKGFKILICAILLGIFIRYREKMHSWFSSLIFSVLIYLLVDSFVSFSNSLVSALLKIDLEPPFDEPYLSTSLQEFWGRRWNLPVTSILREAVYKPVRSASAVVVGGNLAPAFGILAAFLVSGLMHELLLYNSTDTKPSWDMTMFFVLQGFCVVLEFCLKKGLNGRLGQLPQFVSALVTVGFVWMTAICLFFPPFVRSGYHVLVVEEVVYLRKIFHLV